VVDSFGRVIQSRVRGADIDTAGISSFGKSVWIVQDVHYDFFGRREWQSFPRIDGDIIAEGKGSSWEYDNAGRVIKNVTPLGTTTFSYDRNDVSVTQPGPAGLATITKTSQHDALGRVIAVTDATSATTKNVFGPFSQLRRVHLADGTFRETTPDDYGRVILEKDPDATWSPVGVCGMCGCQFHWRKSPRCLGRTHNFQRSDSLRRQHELPRHRKGEATRGLR
jgi:YD repeat-containing protein